ncbi:MAG: preprotein translocase, SecG subunit [Pseudomonadota bacterium]|jgi:preprotein translocase subunit SecG
METFVLVLHVVIALVIVGLIMLQQGKGAEMGASFGSGSSQTIFGAVGSGNLFSRLTAIMVAVFFITSSSLAVMSKNKSKIDDHFLAPATEATAPTEAKKEETAPTADPAKAAIPATEATPKPASGDAGALETK